MFKVRKYEEWVYWYRLLNNLDDSSIINYDLILFTVQYKMLKFSCIFDTFPHSATMSNCSILNDNCRFALIVQQCVTSNMHDSSFHASL